VLSSEQLKDALILKANNFHSSYCRNDGNGKFTLVPLPWQAQLSAINGMTVEDLDGDGNLDAILNTNDFGTSMLIGRYDALNGLVLKGDGAGGFRSMTILESGLFIPGDGKALAKLRSRNERCLIAATQNKGPLKLYALRRSVKNIALQPDDVSAEIIFKNRKKRKQEFYYGASFLSQSSRFQCIDENVDSMIIYDTRGNKRTQDF
jgi:hypothetical protein